MPQTLELPLRLGAILVSDGGLVLVDRQNIVRINNTHSIKGLAAMTGSPRFHHFGIEGALTKFQRISAGDQHFGNNHSDPYSCLCRAIWSWPQPSHRDLANLSRHLPDAIALLSELTIREVWLAEERALGWWAAENDVSIDSLSPLVQKFVRAAGPITAIEDLPRQVASAYPLRAAVAHYRIPSAADAYLGHRYFSTGYGATSEIARFKAVMNGLERFTSGVVDRETSVWAPTRSFLDDGRLFRLLGIDRDAYLRKKLLCQPPASAAWPAVPVQLFSATRGVEQWLVPDDAVYYPLRPRTRERFAIANSSGVAIHQSWEQAVTGALAEYADRHYLMHAWCSGRGFRQCRRDSLPLKIREKIERLQAVCPEAQVKLLVHPGKTFFAAYACFLRDSWPAFHLSSAAHRDPLPALEKSLDELANAMLFCETFWQPIDVTSVCDAVDHYCYYHSPARAAIAHDWASSGETVDWDDVPQQQSSDFATLFDSALAEYGEIAIADLTAPELKAAGLTAVRVLTEKGLPAWFGNGGVPTAKAIWRQDHLDENRWIHPLG